MENKSGRIFYVRKKSLLYKFLPTNLGACKPTFYTFLYITSEEKKYYEALFLSYRPRTKCSISQFFRTNCIHSIFGPSKHAWTFSETVQKISKITYSWVARDVTKNQTRKLSILLVSTFTRYYSI